MTAMILEIFDHYANQQAVAQQEYDLAKAEVDTMLRKGYHRMPVFHGRFNAAVERRDQARRRWIRAIGA